MSVAVYIECERQPDDVDTFVDGKAIGHVDPDLLGAIAKRAGETPLDEFMSHNPDDYPDVFDDVGVPGPAEEWFSARDGLATVQGLRNHLADNPDAVPDADAIIRDLDDFERVLIILDRNEIRFHFAVDI